MLTLIACHIAGKPAPVGLLDELARITGSRIAPRPKFVLKALEDELERRSIPDAYATGRALLPGIDGLVTG